MELTAGILAGGKSSRMGCNKALLEMEGSTFLERTLRLFGSMEEFEQLLVSTAEQQEYEGICSRIQKQGKAAGKSFGLVVDERQGYGPLEGVYRLLLASRHDWVFVAAVDMPYMNREAIRYMIQQQQEDVWAVLPRAGGRIHPLFGLYSKRAVPGMEEMFQQEIHKIGRIREWIPVKTVDMEEEGLGKSVLVNVNTPLEYEEMCKANLHKLCLDTDR